VRAAASLLTRRRVFGVLLGKSTLTVVIMIDSSDFRTKRMPLNRGAGHMPVLGLGTLIPDAAATISATRDALEAGFDTWSRYYTKYFRAALPLLPRISPGTLWSGFIATSRVSLSRLLIAAQSQNRCLPSP